MDFGRYFWRNNEIELGEGARKFTRKVRRVKVWSYMVVEEIATKRKGIKVKLTQQLEDLMEKKVNKESLTKIIDTKIHFNLEIYKDERF